MLTARSGEILEAMTVSISGSAKADVNDESPGYDGKHLIFLFDGTWNSAAAGSYKDITNIFKITRSLSSVDKRGRPQVMFYSPGPGSRGALDKPVGGAFGAGLDEIVKEAYVNLSSNYSERDKVYLLGFSRGAIAARALSCLIAEVGLLRSKHIDFLAKAWSHFVNVTRDDRSSTPSNDLAVLKEFCHEGKIRIEFLGLFDAVFGRKYSRKGRFSELRFENRSLSPIVKSGVHLLSIDDNRRAFRPMLWNSVSDGQKVEQIWMPGVHGDVGGLGSGSFIEAAAFLTMIARLKRDTRLAFYDDIIQDELDELEKHKEIRISNEREAKYHNFIWNINRAPDHDGVNQRLHPLCKLMYEKKFIIRNRRRVYRPKGYRHFAKLDPAESAFSAQIEKAFNLVQLR